MSSKVGLGGLLGVCLVAALGACAVGVDDAPGIGQASDAVKEEKQCGGIAGLQCPSGYLCVDDPTDGCDPGEGGSDCIGICRKDARGRTKCDRGPRFDYVARDPDTCAVIRFYCAEGTPFFNDCGCGCELPLGEPCNQTTCGAGEYCCNSSCSICAPEGGFCTEQYCG